MDTNLITLPCSLARNNSLKIDKSMTAIPT